MENSQIIAEAYKIASLTPKPEPPEGGNDGSEELDVTRIALSLRRHMSEKSIATRTLLAVPIMATIVGVEFEESSQRYKATYRAAKTSPGFDEVETIRSDRVDSAHGAAVKRLWADVKPGQRACIYKYLEPTNDPKKPSVRVAPYIHVFK